MQALFSNEIGGLIGPHNPILIIEALVIACLSRCACVLATSTQLSAGPAQDPLGRRAEGAISTTQTLRREECSSVDTASDHAGTDATKLTSVVSKGCTVSRTSCGCLWNSVGYPVASSWPAGCFSSIGALDRGRFIQPCPLHCFWNELGTMP